MVFLDALSIRRDGGAFDGNAVFFGGIACVNRHLVIGAVAFGKTEVVVFGL